MATTARVRRSSRAAAAARAAEPEPDDEQYEEELDFEDESAEPPVAPQIPLQPASQDAAAALAAAPAPGLRVCPRCRKSVPTAGYSWQHHMRCVVVACLPSPTD